MMQLQQLIHQQLGYMCLSLILSMVPDVVSRTTPPITRLLWLSIHCSSSTVFQPHIQPLGCPALHHPMPSVRSVRSTECNLSHSNLACKASLELRSFHVPVRPVGIPANTGDCCFLMEANVCLGLSRYF